MAAITALSPLLATTAPPGAAPPRLPGATDFGAMLAGTLMPALPRQDGAGDGKDLPAIPDDDAGADMAVGWNAPPMLPPVLPPPATDAAPPVIAVAGTPIVPPATLVTAGGVISGQPRSPERAPSPGAGGCGARIAYAADPAAGSPAPAVPIAGSPPVAAVALDPVLRPATPPVHDPIADHATATTTAAPMPNPAIDPARAPQADPATTIIAGPRVAPAAQMFAGALRHALRDTAQPTAVTPATIVAAATDFAPHAVTAANEARDAALDLHRADWPETMIARIERLRDGADANDTRIRLVPDALGTIHVALKRDGDTVQVRFDAAQPETRQLLAEAQPRLDALAEARGIRLSGGDAGAGHPQHQPPAFRPAAPPASARADNDDDPSTDHRIA